jgi:3-hydroxymyristoyl/3-hydroxydecanoyl-(acyl carrier protein) dehydratase
MSEHRVERVINSAHPSLRGHFPGNPVVPGVVLLDEVVAVVVERRGRDFRPDGFPAVKFLSPLLPDVPFTIVIRDPGGARVEFECLCDGRVLLRGTVAGANP